MLLEANANPNFIFVPNATSAAVDQQNLNQQQQNNNQMQQMVVCMQNGMRLLQMVHLFAIVRALCKNNPVLANRLSVLVLGLVNILKQITFYGQRLKGERQANKMQKWRIRINILHF